MTICYQLVRSTSNTTAAYRREIPSHPWRARPNRSRGRRPNTPALPGVYPMVATDSPPDSVLVARTLDGDRGAFEVLVRRHYRAAFSIALAYAPTRADAEDVCQDAFFRAAAKLRECRDGSRFIFWLCAIVRNHARNAATRGGSRRSEALRSEIVAPGRDPGREAELQDLRLRLERALAVLSPVQREVVLLHDLDGWTHGAIAEVIGTSAGMSRQHLFNARRRLREALGENTWKEYSHD